MKIAIPLVEGRLAAHFGHCGEFALVEVEDGSVRSVRRLPPPPHQPGALPRWLRQQGAELVIAGGMGRRAQALFGQSGIEVVVGAPSEEPERLVEQYMSGRLEAGENICDH